MPDFLDGHSEADEAVLERLADVHNIAVRHFPGLDSFFGAPLVGCDLDPLLFLFFGDVDALGHHFAHVLEVVVVAALATPGRDALGLGLLLVAGLAILVPTGIVVLDHGRAHGVLEDDFLIIIGKRVVVEHVVGD